MLKSHSVPPIENIIKSLQVLLASHSSAGNTKSYASKVTQKFDILLQKKVTQNFEVLLQKKSRSKITFFPTPPKPKILSQVSDVIHLSLLYILVIYFHFLSFELFDARIRNWSEGIVSQDTQEITRVRKSLTKSPLWYESHSRNHSCDMKVAKKKSPKKSHSKVEDFASKKSHSKVQYFADPPPNPNFLSQVSDVIHLSSLSIK